ncbi:hypothetical protein H5T88_05435 [bacterium]|nr:hypothetical protein [bacterium]
MMTYKILFPILFLLTLSAKLTFPLSIEKLIVAPVLPCKGERFKLRINLKNEEDKPIENVSISLYLQDGGREKEIKKITIPKLETGENKLEIGEWIAKESGIYNLKVKVIAKGKVFSKETSFPVVERKVEFAWYGTPKDLKFPTICTTIRQEEIEEWLWEGRIPLVFKPGVCYWSQHPESKIEEQVACWSNIPKGAEGIGIDEYGACEVSDKVLEAIKMFKRNNPNLKIALWTTGGDEEKLSPYVDYFLPEVYLNYHNMHLGVLEEAIKGIKEKRLERQTLIGLGINYEPQHRTLLTAPAELEEQFRLIKSSCPDILGVAIFYYGSVPQLDRLSDELFYRYFVLPVYSYEWTIGKEKGIAKVKGKVKNIGNMKGKEVEVLLLVDGKNFKKEKIDNLKVNREKDFTFELKGLKKGFHIIRVRIIGDANSTVLNNEKEEVLAVGISPPSPSSSKGFSALWLPPSPMKRENQPLYYKLPKGWRSARVISMDQNGVLLKEFPCQINSEGEAIWMEDEIPAGERRFYLLFEVERKCSTIFFIKEKWTFENEYYRASFDLERDELNELSVEGENLFSSPWKLELQPVKNLNILREKIALNQGEVFSELVIPFESEELKGYSRYTLFRKSPLIEIRRSITPKGEIETEGAREGASLTQREGVFQAYAGEGALRISKGRLEVSDKYRDLYFGYLGSSPSPDNRRKAGWFDFSWIDPPIGLGIAIIERWIDSKSKTYDVTRFYDGGDWIDIFYVFQTKSTLNRQQESKVYLLPHRFSDLEKDKSPIQPFYWTAKKGLREAFLLP